jgi:hypothetical protein
LPSLVSAQRMIGLHQHNAVTVERQDVPHETSGTDRPGRGCPAHACVRSCRRAPGDRVARGSCDHRGSRSAARPLCRIATPRTASSLGSRPRSCVLSCAADRCRRARSIGAMGACGKSGFFGPSYSRNLRAGEKVGDGVCLSGSSLDAGGVPARRSGYGSWHPVAQVFILWLMVEVGDRERDSNDRQLGHIIRGRLGFHFFFGFGLSIVAGTAIFSFSSVQVLRTSAVTSEQFSI